MVPFYFHTSFEAPQRSVKIKIWVNFFFISGIETEKVKTFLLKY